MSTKRKPNEAPVLTEKVLRDKHVLAAVAALAKETKQLICGLAIAGVVVSLFAISMGYEVPDRFRPARPVAASVVPARTENVVKPTPHVESHHMLSYWHEVGAVPAGPDSVKSPGHPKGDAAAKKQLVPRRDQSAEQRTQPRSSSLSPPVSGPTPGAAQLARKYAPPTGLLGGSPKSFMQQEPDDETRRVLIGR